jgi:hypothetical protein
MKLHAVAPGGPPEGHGEEANIDVNDGDVEMTYIQPLRITLEDSRQPKLLNLLLHATRQPRIHATATTKHNSLIKRGSNIDFRRLNSIEQKLRNTRLFTINQMRLKQTFRRLEAFAAKANDTTVRECIALNEHGRIFAEALVELKIIRNIAQLLLDLAHSLKVSRSIESVAATEEKRDELARDVPTRDVEPAREMV